MSVKGARTILASTLCVGLLSAGGVAFSQSNDRSPFLEMMANSFGYSNYDGDARSLDIALKRAETVGFEVKEDPVEIKTIPSSLQDETIRDVNEDYQKQADAIQDTIDDFLKSSESSQSFSERMNKYKKDERLYQKRVKSYPTDLEDYEKNLKIYDDAVKNQITNANPDKALTPDHLAIEQPFTLKNSRSTLVTVPKDFKKDSKSGFSSDSSYSVSGKSINEKSSYSFVWKNVAVDKTSGRTLNAEITVDDFVLDSTVDSKGQGAPLVKVYSNYADNLTINGITSMREKLTLSYSDGTLYDKPFYMTMGSLNAQGSKGERREFAAPGEGVKASFVHKNSVVLPEVQEVSGSASQKMKKAFMTAPSGQRESISDASKDALEKIGVTFLVDNSASVYVGVSGSNGEPAKMVPANDSLTKTPIRTTYNHILLSSSTVADTAVKPEKPAQPIEPVKPIKDSKKPGVITYRLQKIIVQKDS